MDCILTMVYVNGRSFRRLPLAEIAVGESFGRELILGDPISLDVATSRCSKERA